MHKKTITAAAVRAVLRDYWSQYKKYPWQTLIALLFPAFGTICIFFVPPLIVAKIINTFVSTHTISLSSTGWLIALFGFLWLCGEVFWRIGMHFLIRIETVGLGALGKKAFGKLAERDYVFYSNNFVGSLTKVTMSYVRGFEGFTDTIGFNVLNNLVPIVFSCVILWRYSPIIPLVLLLLVGVTIAVAVPIIRRRSRLVTDRHVAQSAISGRLSDIITNILAVKSFSAERKEGASFAEYVDDYTSKFKKAADFQNLRFDLAISPLYIFTNTLGLVLAVFMGGRLGLEAGTILIIFSYFGQVTRIFWDFQRIYRNIENSISEAAEFSELMLKPPAVEDRPGAGVLEPLSPDIEFRDVSFSYQTKDAQTEHFLEHFDLKIPAGQKVGLVGPSGGGKTTITKLLLRFLDVNAGEICIGGSPISAVSQASLRRTISYVPQEPLLFHRSLRENIAYGDEQASEADIIDAAQLAHADEFIRELPQGYDALVGERGVKLSGGQRQRVAIARAILKKAPIIILDEATSALDSESEKYIQDGLVELMKGKTAVVIAHRLSTIKHLDRIIVLDDGEIIEDGTHDELLEKGGMYAKLWSRQSGQFLEE